MRPVDSPALSAVARALGIQNPSTATELLEFDDGNLQQTLDVDPIVRQSASRLSGQNSGWLELQVRLTLTAGAGFKSTSQTISNVAIPAMAERDVLWIYSVDMDIQGPVVTDVSLAYLFASQPAIAAIQGTPIAATVAFGSNAIAYGATSGKILTSLHPPADHVLPYPVGDGGSLSMIALLGGAAGATTLDYTILCRILPENVPPPPVT